MKVGTDFFSARMLSDCCQSCLPVRLSGLISGRGINIQNMLNKSRGEIGVTVLELAQHPDDTLLAALGKLKDVVRARLI